MHSATIGVRHFAAMERIRAAAEALTEAHPELRPFVERMSVVNKDREVQELFRREAVAEFLEALVDPSAAVAKLTDEVDVAAAGEETSPEAASAKLVAAADDASPVATDDPSPVDHEDASVADGSENDASAAAASDPSPRDESDASPLPPPVVSKPKRASKPKVAKEA